MLKLKSANLLIQAIAFLLLSLGAVNIPAQDHPSQSVDPLEKFLCPDGDGTKNRLIVTFVTHFKKPETDAKLTVFRVVDWLNAERISDTDVLIVDGGFFTERVTAGKEYLIELRKVVGSKFQTLVFGKRVFYSGSRNQNTGERDFRVTFGNYDFVDEYPSGVFVFYSIGESIWRVDLSDRFGFGFVYEGSSSPSLNIHWAGKEYFEVVDRGIHFSPFSEKDGVKMISVPLNKKGTKCEVLKITSPPF